MTDGLEALSDLDDFDVSLVLMRKNSQLIFNALLPFVDFFAIISAFVLSYILRVKIDQRPVPNPIRALLFFKIFVLVIPVWIFIFALLGLYSLSSTRSRWDELGKVFIGVSGGTMFLIMLDFFSRTPIFPARSIPIYGYILSFIFVVTARLIVDAVQRFLFRFNYGIHRVLLVGSGPIARSIFQSLNQTNRTGYKVVAILDQMKVRHKAFAQAKTIRSLDELNGTSIDEILQADSALPQDDVLALINYANNHQIVYRFVPNQFGLFATNSKVAAIAGQQVIEIQRTPLEGWGRIAKRAFDIIGSGLALILLSPVFLAVAIAIRLSDNGPIFYKHQRLSRSGNPVGVYKFRSMYWKYSPGPGRPYKTPQEALAAMGRKDLIEEFKANQKLVNDPRVMPVGRFIRRTSLDELPQFLNVLRGDMSLVGPRPIVEEELARYGGSSAVFLSLKPGLTGLWQISGRNDISYDERVKLDIYYVEHWSILLDIKILLKTVITVLGKGGAY